MMTEKRMLMVTPLFPSKEKPYYCIYLLQMIESLKMRGYTVDILMPDRALADGEVVKSEYQGFRQIKIGYKSGMLDEIFGRVSVGFQKSAEEIVSALRPDVIDLNLCASAISRFMISAAKKFGAKSVMHYHGLNVFCNYQPAHPLLEKVLEINKRWIANHADGIIGVSDKINEIVCEKSGNRKVYTVYNGVDAELFHKAEHTNNSVFTVICVANLIPIKGQELLLRAAHNVLCKHGHRMNIQLVGEGPEKERLQKLAVELGIGDAVEFLGALNYDVVAQKVREADFFVMPSYFEALGCVYLEAMASNVAVLGVNGCGIDEIVEDKVNGYLVDPRSVEQIEERLVYAIENPEQHAQIAGKGHETVMQKYLWKHAAAALDRAYSELLNGGAEDA